MAQENEKEAAEAVDGMIEQLDDVLENEEVAVATNFNLPAQDSGASESSRLIQLAIERDADVDKLERLIELRNREIARQAKAEYEQRFSAMQRQFGKILRTREATDANGKVMYSYAPLEDIVAVVGPTIADFGFRYHFEEERIEGSSEKRIWCIVSGCGHEERTYVDIPIPEPSKMTNAIQQRGSASSYGKRYAFLAAFGLTLADEDDEGRSCSVNEVSAMVPGLAKLEAATTLDDLKVAFKEVLATAESESQKLLVINTKNRRKEEINAGK
jgi:hypothetical protein